MRAVITFTIFCVVTLVLACKKHEKSPLEQLPPETRDGKGTFGCLMNGKAFVPYGPPVSFGQPNPSPYYHQEEDGGSFAVQTRRNYSDGTFEMLTIGGSPIADTGTYQLNGLDPDATGVTAFFISVTKCLYRGNKDGNSCTGSLHITRLDKTNKIIAGTFWATLISPTCDTLRFTDGRFDVKTY